jgi:pimeloyl-ACP methyl ester carboxylesterase
MAVPAGLTYVQTGDLRTRYREWGTSGSPIVLVHGFVESADTWQYTAPRLAAAGHRVYALDLDGWGYSQRVAPFTAEHETTQLLDFIAALHLHRPVMVGHSSGAAIVAMAALRRPTALGGVMFLDGDALDTGAGARSPLAKLLIDPYRTTILRLVLRSDAFIRSVYGSACGSSCPPLDAHGIDQWRRPLQVSGAEAALWAMARQGVPGLPPATLAQLATTDLPKAVVFGADDSDFAKSSPYTTAARIGAPPPTLILGARHLTPVNSPGAVAAAVLALVRRVGPG